MAAIALAATISAQTDNLPKDTIDGKVVYRYTVQKSEGLYRISKTFDCTQEELVKLNPKLQTEGLKYGQTIFVPAKQAETEAPAGEPQYIKHVVQPKETFYALSKRYGVTAEAIQAANPQLDPSKMQIGMQVLIPVKNAPAANSANLQLAGARAHADELPAKEVPAKEVPAKEIAANVLQAAEQNIEKAAETAAEQPAPALAEIPAVTDSVSSEAAPTISAIPLRIAYLLPLQADAVKRDASMDRFVDFYEGALLAIYEAQLSGQRFDIYTYDIQKSDIAIQQVLTKGEMSNMDAIIGPAYPAQVSHAAMFAKQNHIPCVIPFTNKVSNLDSNPYLLQFNPTDAMEAEVAIEQLKADKEQLQLVFVDPQAADVPPFVSTLRRCAEAAGLAIAETTVREILNDSLSASLQKGKKNILVFNAEKYSSVGVLMNKIISQKNGHDIALFGRYSWKNEKSPIPMVYISMFREPATADLAAYEALYKQYFGHALSSTNPRYDLLGYDITRSTISYLLRTQQSVTEADKDAAFGQTYHGLQSDTRYSRTNEGGGRINMGIHLIWK